MNRADLQELSRMRRREAKALLRAGQFAGAYYLAGYSVECALKACIAKSTKKHDFPDKQRARDAWDHNLEKLLALAELALDLEKEAKANSAFERNWAVVKDWKVESRYLTTKTASEAKDLYNACNSIPNGVLRWIRAKW